VKPGGVVHGGETDFPRMIILTMAELAGWRCLRKSAGWERLDACRHTSFGREDVLLSSACHIKDCHNHHQTLERWVVGWWTARRLIITGREDPGLWSSAFVGTRKPVCRRKGKQWLGCDCGHNRDAMSRVAPNGLAAPLLETLLPQGEPGGILAVHIRSRN